MAHRNRLRPLILFSIILLLGGCSRRDEDAGSVEVQSGIFDVHAGTVTAGERKKVTVKVPLNLAEPTPVWYLASSAPNVTVLFDRNVEPTVMLEAGEDLEIPLVFAPPGDFSVEHFYTYVVLYREDPSDRTQKLRIGVRVHVDVQTAESDADG